MWLALDFNFWLSTSAWKSYGTVLLLEGLKIGLEG
jgi:hypothetical protein